MLRPTRLVLSLVFLSSLAHAERDEPPLGDRSMSMFREGTALYNGPIRTYRDSLMRACIGDPSQKWLENLTALDEKVAKLSKPDDKRQLTEYLAVLRKWVEERTRTIPDVGTWDDGRAAVRAMRDLAEVPPPPVGTGDAAVKAMIDYAVKVSATMRKAGKATGYASNRIHGCEEFFGKTGELFEVHKKLEDNMSKYQRALSDLAADVVKNKLEPFHAATVTLAEQTTANDWDGMVKQTAAAFDTMATAKDILANEAFYLALGEYTPDQHGPEWAVPEAKKQVAALGSKIAKMVEDVSFPQANGPADPARDKVVRSAFAGKKILNGPAQLPGVAKDTFTEVENGVKYAAKRETASAYYVAKPAEWKTPVPDGLAADELCEMHWVYLMRWTAGPPRRKKALNQWQIETDRVMSPMLCKNAKRVSSLK